MMMVKTFLLRGGRTQCQLLSKNRKCYSTSIANRKTATFLSLKGSGNKLKLCSTNYNVHRLPLSTTATPSSSTPSFPRFISTLLLAGGLATFVTGGRSSPIYGYMADIASKHIMSRIDPERAHNLTISLLKAGFGPKFANVQDTYDEEEKKGQSNNLKISVFNRDFPNIIGMAAGFDKQAEVIEPLFDLGFGFVEVGGVTPNPQEGNPKPRMFRLPEDQGCINRFGLNSEGHAIVSERLNRTRNELREKKKKGIISVNLAKNSGDSDLIEDYCKGVRALGPFVDLIVINVSCPNVKWTKNLGKGNASQSKKNHYRDDTISKLVKAVIDERNKLVVHQESEKKPSVLMKLSPDMNQHTREKMAAIALDRQIDGLIIGNTSSKRSPELTLSKASAAIGDKEHGGLSGAPIRHMALESIGAMYTLTNGSIPIVGCGGISSGQHAYDCIKNGASLIQFYTAMAYKGPSIVRTIQSELLALMEKDGFSCVEEAVGINHKK